MIMAMKGDGVEQSKGWIGLLRELRVGLSILFLISALLMYWVLTSTNNAASSVIAISSDQKNTKQEVIATLPAPAKKLTKLLEQSINTPQKSSALDVDQAITKANQTIDNLDQQLVALGYQPDIVNDLKNINLEHIDSVTNKSDPVVIERFEKLKARIQQ